MSQQKRFCPNCGSTWVEPDTSNRAEVYFSGGNPNKWQCNNCDYTGLMPEGDPKVDLSKEDSENSEEDIKFEPEEEYPRKDIGFGIGYLKYLIFILFPALTLFIAYNLIVT
jgi:ribosomal protein S27AE